MCAKGRIKLRKMACKLLWWEIKLIIGIDVVIFVMIGSKKKVRCRCKEHL